MRRKEGVKNGGTVIIAVVAHGSDHSLGEFYSAVLGQWFHRYKQE
jgi:hypothetical protein